MKKSIYLVFVKDDRGWLDVCQDVKGVFLGDVDAPLDYEETGIIGCLVEGRAEADALKRELTRGFSTNEQVRPPVYAVKRLERKDAHYSSFGASMQPCVADRMGFVYFREYFEYLPREQWTAGEEWIAKQNERKEG